jgi:hypothetical protein
VKPVYVEGVGIFGVGLVGWEQARTVFAGAAPYTPAPVPPLKPAALPPDARRRTSDHIRVAIEVASEAVRRAGADGSALASVFATSESDGGITHDICSEVVKDQPQVSPTKFHNSVTNAAAGYWCMAVGSQQPSTSVAAWDASFTVGLIEALSQLLTDQPRVLLVAHDMPLPEPLNSVRPIASIFGAALVLARDRSPHSVARLSAELRPATRPDTALADVGLEHLRLGNPAARALPLLAALARRADSDITLAGIDGLGVSVQVTLCA